MAFAGILKNRTEALIHTLCWVAGYLAVVAWVNTLGAFRSVDGTLLLPVTVGTLVNIFLFYAVALLLIPQYAATKRAFWFVCSVLLFWLGLTALETLIDYLFFINYYSTEDEGFWGQLVTNLLLNLVILSLGLGYGFTKTWLRNEKQRQQLKEEMLQAELNFLKAQVNPHFLFNVLNMAYASAVRNGDETTAGIVEKLANLMRYMLYESNVKSIALNKEIEYIKSFIELQKMRLSPELNAAVSFVVEGAEDRHSIAPLLLIPFVENAFKHGVRLDKPSEIVLRLQVANGKLHFYTENSIAQTRHNLGSDARGVGLENVKKRLALLYPNTHDLHINQTDEKFKVELTIEVD